MILYLFASCDFSWPKSGLIECLKDGVNLYDRKQLRKAIKRHGALSANKLLSQILSERDERIGDLPPEDDVTVVVVEGFPGTQIYKTTEVRQ